MTLSANFNSVRFMLKSYPPLHVAVIVILSGCSVSHESQPLTVYSQIEFEFATQSDNSVFGLQQRPLVLPDRTDVPDEFKNPLPRCTGFFVAQRLFVTAFHCVPNLQVARFNFVSTSSDWLGYVMAGSVERLLYVGKTQESQFYSLSGDDLLWTNTELDVALVRWPHAVDHGVLSVCRESIFEKQKNIQVQLLGFPHGLPLSRSVGKAYPLQPSLSSLLFAHDADSLAGESGGPVLALGENTPPCVVGIHIRGGGRNQFTSPLTQSEQLSALEYAVEACLNEPLDRRSQCEQAYSYNKSVRVDRVLDVLKNESVHLWSEIIE